MRHGKTLGLPLHCPGCPSKFYFGILRREAVPTDLVRVTKADVCPNCGTTLVSSPTRLKG